MTSSLTSSPAMARLHATTGARELGWAIRGDLRVEDDDANSPVQETTTDDDERRPATRSDGGAARLDGDDGAPAACDGGEGAAELLLLRANPVAATDGNGDDASGGAMRPENHRRWRRLGQRGGGATGDASAWDLRQTEEDD
uniref:Putative unclassified transposon protein n=1 Tax=Oryza sativa subsp. indica TaxID=39946 RepID=C5NNV4_ORYSI|nr:putative unclassified transposon protein [Oryza sativa Indica Group]